MAKKGTLVLLLAAFIFTFTVAGCSKPGVSKDNFDKVEVGMTLAEVEGLLGEGKKGTSITGKLGEMAGQGSAYVWEDGDKKVTVMFKDDKVLSKAAIGLEEKK